MVGEYQWTLSTQRLNGYLSDADAFRRGIQENSMSGIGVSREAAQIGALVRKAISAISRCRWIRAEQAIRELERRERIPCATVAAKALLAQATGDQESAAERMAQLRNITPPSSADANVWAAATIAAALRGYSDGRVDDSAQPIALLLQLCSKARDLSSDVMEFLCLSLALLAKAGKSPVLASYLLGHLTDRLGGVPQMDGYGTPDSRLGGWLPASYAATGLCMITLGDVNGGYRFLLSVIDAERAVKMPLVAGLVGAELAITELEHGTQSSALPWIERTRRFANRYDCPLPADVIRRVREQLPVK